MSKFTPGPWALKVIEPLFGELRHDMEARIEAPLKLNGEGTPGLFYNVATLSFVAMKRNPHNILRDEGNANARLMVEAPEMYEALTTFEILIKRSQPPQTIQTGGGIDAKQLLADTRAILKRIDGEGQ